MYVTFIFIKSDYFSLQFELFHNIRPLFANKPLLMVVNKIDVKKIDELDAEGQVTEKEHFLITDSTFVEVASIVYILYYISLKDLQ